MSEHDGEAGARPADSARIEEALGHLDRLEQLPVDQHQAVFEQIHAGLRDALDAAGRDEDRPARS